jgi:hypothetical protein
MAWIIGKSWWKNRHGAKNYSSWLTFFKKVLVYYIYILYNMYIISRKLAC